MRTRDTLRLEPVAAYDCLAPQFRQLSERRRHYLDRVEQLIIREVPAGASSLLDVGAGDGERALRIAGQARIANPVLLEPSEGMRAFWPRSVESWPIAAEDLCAKQASFDVILCLWNVLGHVAPADQRVGVLRQVSRLLTSTGMAFVDVNNRYNARHYGLLPTAARCLRDLVFPSERNGDVVASWEVDAKRYSTTGHVFTPKEFAGLAQAAGLIIRKTFLVDYETGQLRSSPFSANPLYLLGRSPR